MDSHTLALLQFDRIIAELKEYAVSDGGRRLLDGQVISKDKPVIAEALNAQTAFRKALQSGEVLGGIDFPDITPLFRRLSKEGAFLEPEELGSIGVYIESASKLRGVIGRLCDDPLLKTLSDNIPDLSGAAACIFAVIERNGEINEEKIPELKAIKRKLSGLSSEIDRLIKGYIDNPSYAAYWQSDMPTLRDGRAVLPMKANFKGRIKGVVHEVSTSGATVFLEPFDVVEKNNQVKQGENEFRRHLIAVLKDLTRRVSGELDSLLSMEKTVSRIDTIYARSRYAIIHQCNPAELSDTTLDLRNARHPLLGPEVVPTTITINDTSRVLIITGPNTGGKTVTLKTVGLLSAMTQFGMEIPADEGSVLPVFDSIYADIGDEQSLEQSLSTFSGHIVNLSRIIGGSSGESLVLLDELGAGTDPEEGVAIAMAILDHFIEKGSMVISTTHHGILKNYGYTRDSVENAAMEFDTETLTPRYRLIMGVPGESYALTIAGRHGIPSEIIDHAKRYLSDERTDISRLIRKLSEKQRELLQEEMNQRVREKALLEEKRRADLKELRLRQKEYELRKHGIRELRDFFLKSRKELEKFVLELREGEVTKDKVSQLKDRLRGIEKKVRAEERLLQEQFEGIVERSAIPVQTGMTVRIKNTGKIGKVIRKVKGGRWIVETPTMKVTLSAHEIEAAGEETDKNEGVVTTMTHGLSGDPVLQMDLRGYRLEDALRQIEKQIDGAIIRGLREFSIIHGKGDGILQQGVHRYLKKCPVVSDYHFSRPEEGGFGKTIVILEV
ncbi:MAG: endonuclease MutS2 [Spirochaetales bacterium]|nr:endonuclease MutS2 [Spirochaetales bacterium]